MRIIIIFLSALLFSCDNIDERINQTVDAGIKNTKAQMDKDVLNAKAIFKNKYDSIVSKAQEPQKSEIQGAFLSITNSAEFIDNLRGEMDKLNETNTDDINLIRELFITKGQADSVFNKLNNSYTLAQKISRTESNKIAIKKISDNSLNFSNGVNGWKNQFFQQNTPFGTEMILFGLETELLKAGCLGLDGN